MSFLRFPVRLPLHRPLFFVENGGVKIDGNLLQRLSILDEASASVLLLQLGLLSISQLDAMQIQNGEKGVFFDLAALLWDMQRI